MMTNRQYRETTQEEDNCKQESAFIWMTETDAGTQEGDSQRQRAVTSQQEFCREFFPQARRIPHVATQRASVCHCS